MKYFSLALICLAIKVNAAEPDTLEKCRNVSDLAQLIMEARQKGASMADLMDGIQGSSATSMGEKMVQDAFDVPRYPEGHRQDPITDFGNTWYQLCLRAEEVKQDSG